MDNSAQMDAFETRMSQHSTDFERHWQRVTEQRCGLIPAQTHCWHEQLTLWSDLFPPEMVCCWCEATTRDMTMVPHRHGPYMPEG